MITGTIFKIKKYALHDGPGIRTTVFFKGCPLACSWCHNPEGIDPRPQPMTRRSDHGTIRETVGTVVDTPALVRVISQDQLFYDQSGGGVTFSGGEPLAQPAFLEAVLTACNRLEIHAALDTSGHAPADVLARILPRVQLVLCDLKVMAADEHRRYTGVSNATILENIRRMADGPAPLRLRIPLVPGITDTEANLDQVIRFLATLKPIQGIDLLPYHRIGAAKYQRLGMVDRLAAISPPDAARVAAVKQHIEAAGFDISIGG